MAAAIVHSPKREVCDCQSRGARLYASGRWAAHFTPQRPVTLERRRDHPQSALYFRNQL